MTSTASFRAEPEHCPSWTPILTGSDRSEALSAIDDIAAALRPELFATANLANGDAGAALFFATLAQAQPERAAQHIDVAFDFLDRAIASLVSGQVQMSSLYSGFTGIAWVAEQFRTSDEDDPNSDIDEVLMRHLGQRPWRKDYDLISGLAGYALYALDRNNAAMLSTIIDRLWENAEVTPDGSTWFTEYALLHPQQKPLYPNGYYNLGLAHGVPGVIAILGQACARGIAEEKARPLLDGAVRWLLAQKNREEIGFCFRTVVLREEDRLRPSRVAWCYGDLGIALALLWAARSVGESAWEAEALDIARHAALRANGSTGVVDASICHGTAGNAHLFNRLYQATGEPLFRAAAHHWLAKTFAFRRDGEGIGGFQTWRADRDGWEDVPGLLEGSIGIGLALIAATSSVMPDWDRMLLVSVPPR